MTCVVRVIPRFALVGRHAEGDVAESSENESDSPRGSQPFRGMPEVIAQAIAVETAVSSASFAPWI